VKGKKMIVSGLSIGFILLMVIILGCIGLKGPKLLIREPQTPQESSLSYTPPPIPSFNLEMLGGSADRLLSLIRPRVVQVRERVYVAIGFDLANVAMIKTDDGLVIVDSAGSREASARIMKELRKISNQPVKYLIYTHYHPDHTQGAKEIISKDTEIIATRAFLYWIDYQNNLLAERHHRARAIQAGVMAQEYSFKLPIRNPFSGIEVNAEVVMPTITFESSYDFTLGGVRFELFATSGETQDHLAIWMPEERVLFAGDLYYASFPNLSSPMLESRPVLGWAHSLERFIQLEPEYLVLGHTEPLKGKDIIKEHLTNYRDAILYVHNETVRCINEGKSVEQAVAEVKLPERLAKLPYLQELYGRVDWSVRGIYHGYLGWYDGEGTGLNPLPSSYRARELVELAGGADKILARAIELQKNGEHQLCAELCDLVIEANPKDALAHRIKASSMAYLAMSAGNLNTFGFYRSAYAMEMKAIQEAINKGK